MAIELRPEDEVSLEELTRRAANAAEVAWVALFLDGLLLGCASLFWIVRGRFFDPGFYEALTGGTWAIVTQVVSPSVERVAAAGVRLAGFLGAMSSIFVTVIALTSFRRLEKWSWYVVWVLPAFAALDFALIAGYGAVTVTSVVWDAALMGLALVALALSYRAIFPRTELAPHSRSKLA
jgi:hypothetical protein